MYNVHVIKLQHVVNLMFLPWQNVYKYQCKELYLEHKKGYSAEKSWLFEAKNRFLRQHLGGPLIPNPQLSQLAVEGHVPSNLVSQFQQLRKGVFLGHPVHHDNVQHASYGKAQPSAHLHLLPTQKALGSSTLQRCALYVAL